MTVTIEQIDEMLERLAIQETTLNVLMEAVDALQAKLDKTVRDFTDEN